MLRFIMFLSILATEKVIEAWPPYVTDTCGVTDWPHPYILGVARPFE